MSMVRAGGNGFMFNPRNIQTMIRTGRTLGNLYNQASSAQSRKQDKVVKVSHSTKTTRTPGGRYKKTHKDTIKNKHDRKAIENVVKSTLNKELELKYKPIYVADFLSGGISHRVCYVQDLAAGITQGDGDNQFHGDYVHLSSVNCKGFIQEVDTNYMRGMPHELEIYLVQRKGDWPVGTGVAAFGGTTWWLSPEDNFVKSETAGDATIDGKMAVFAPRKRNFTVLGKRVLRPSVNRAAPYGTTDLTQGIRSFDFNMKIDKKVKPFAAMSGEEVTDLSRCFLIIRAMGPRNLTYGAQVAAAAQLQTKVFFRDA